MRAHLTAQQASFYTQHRYIELVGINYDSAAVFAAARAALTKRLGKTHHTPEELYAAGRDLWRDDAVLKDLLLKKLSPIALSLAGKGLRLAADQWIPAGLHWSKALALKDLFCIQGLAIGVVLCPDQVQIPKRSQLGLLPLPESSLSALFFQPHVLLDLPKLPQTDIYLAAYALTSAVYIQNPLDPSTNCLKKLGYAFGDVLQNAHHPLLGAEYGKS